MKVLFIFCIVQEDVEGIFDDVDANDPKRKVSQASRHCRMVPLSGRSNGESSSRCPHRKLIVHSEIDGRTLIILSPQASSHEF